MNPEVQAKLTFEEFIQHPDAKRFWESSSVCKTVKPCIDCGKLTTGKRCKTYSEKEKKGKRLGPYKTRPLWLQDKSSEYHSK